MVVIRLSRSGAVHRPFYHVVVADSRSSRDGRFIEHIGFLNYYAKGEEKPYRLDTERLDYWVKRGAKMRPSVVKLLRRSKNGDKPKKKKAKAKPAPAPVPAPVETTEKVEAKSEEQKVKPEADKEAVEEKTESSEATVDAKNEG